MKVRLLALAVVGAGLLLPVLAEPAARPRLTDDLRRRVEDEARATRPAASASASPAEDNPTVLSPLRVKEKFLSPLRRPDEQAPAYHPFTWKDGGTFWRRKGRRVTSEFEFDYNPVHGGIDLLSFSW